MSAIAGILGRVDDAANREALQRMLSAMERRGPDGGGTWTSGADENGNGCLLGHRRLATLDDSPQPISDATLALSCDGSIFSHPSAADVLRELKCSPAQALPRLRGMFALALWDESARVLLLARDPLGQRPLYFAHNRATSDGWSLAFASELRALLASELLGKPRLDPTGVASIVWNGFVMSPATMVQGVSAVMPGQVISFPNGEASHFWRMPDEPAATTEDEADIRRELHDAVRVHLQRSRDARLGVLLSGGIDSSSVANLAQRQLDMPIETYCMAMEEASLDESAAARDIAKAIGSNHHEVKLTEQAFVGALDDAIDSLDQPTFDALNQYHICRALRDAGLKIALGGIGGDAIFGGDKTFAQLPRLRKITRAARFIPLRVPLACLFAPKHSQQRWAKLPNVLKTNGDLLHLYQLTYALFRPDFYEQLRSAKTQATSYGLPAETERWLRHEIEGHSPIEVAGILETRCFVGERLLRDADTVSSACSFELRSPLSDPRVIEQLIRLPARQKFHPVGYKPILRRHGLQGLDARLFDRPKSGFVLPFDRWIRRNLGQAMDQWMRDDRACAAAGLHGQAVARIWVMFQDNTPGIYWTRVWALYVLIRWCHRHGVLV